MSDPARSYDADFYRWTQEQAALLRQVPGERINLPIDWDHAAEEIEDMGHSDLRAVNSRIGVILEHLLKLEYSPAEDPRDGWIDTVARCRDDVSRTLDDSPSLRRKLPERWPKEYALARRGAVRGLARYGTDTERIPAVPPYTLDQVIDPDWWPANRHGHGLPRQPCRDHWHEQDRSSQPCWRTCFPETDHSGAVNRVGSSAPSSDRGVAPAP